MRVIDLVRKYPFGSRWWMEVKDEMVIAVEIADLRDNFGRIDIEVKALHGRGSAWVQADRLKERIEDDAQVLGPATG